jgi:mannose-6-phosphate isomerase-like protein (cupin superfamily)
MNHTDLTESKRGYLNGDFALFHLKDMKSMQFEYHYHDFNKIIIFISGSVTYLVEGIAHRLRPWDILFVSSNEVHKPIIDSAVLYERIVIWVNPGFLQNHSDDCDLFTCFKLAGERKNNLLRLAGT